MTEEMQMELKTEEELELKVSIKQIIKEKYHAALERYRRQFILLAIFFIAIIIIVILTYIPPFNTPDKKYWVEVDVLYDNWAEPSLKHWLGTDEFGRDHFTRLLHAIRNSFLFGLITGSVCTGVAVLTGVIGPFKGGAVDTTTSFITNIALVFPQIPFILLMSAIFEVRSWWITMLFISLFTWPWAARSIRSQVLTLKERNYIKVSKMSGLKDMRIAFIEVLPGVLPYIFLAFIIFLSSAILIEAGIAMVGLGQQQWLTLGLLLNNAVVFGWIYPMRDYWLWLPPGICLIIISLTLFIIQASISKTFEQRKL
ncbi:hypothetical protein LCGC14_0775100 [marine sediment metagenome]|uniref:ABC transmembrane type-1 domain-containing protein n=1 Tax=marine sediment metagenome TaxID=412755 RepID=A0A0F9T448_9ZZZZ|nr:ABC transporter permease [archaeon]